MAVFNIFKETALPQTLEANSIYLIAPAANPTQLEIYVTGKTNDIVRRTINKNDVQLMIDASISGSANSLLIVADIAARNALTLTSNAFVLVQDATADPTVTVGAALYVWKNDTTEWIKIAEYESMDVTIAWSDIQGKPNSNPSAIDSAVQKAHDHTNKTQLDKIGQDANGNLTYSGAPVRISWDSAQW